ncbi:MAG: transposase, partial [Enterococcus gallinarum]|nr:transposase [Enterococcus gallinarum]
HCWAHARRKWVEALELGGKASSPAVRLGKMVCDALFRMERDWQEMPIMARDQLRQKFARPLLEDFYRWLETQFAAPKSALDKAITYCLNQKAGLLKFLEVPALPIHNNGAENAIRPLTLGKKNWLFSTSEAGGKANAIYLSLVETYLPWSLAIIESCQPAKNMKKAA